jgi:hypothetical protein
MPPKGSDLIFDHRHNADERALASALDSSRSTACPGKLITSLDAHVPIVPIYARWIAAHGLTAGCACNQVKGAVILSGTSVLQVEIQNLVTHRPWGTLPNLRFILCFGIH